MVKTRNSSNKKRKLSLVEPKYLKKNDVVIPDDIEEELEEIKKTMIEKYIKDNEFNSFNNKKQINLDDIEDYEENFKKSNLLENIANTSVYNLAHDRKLLKNMDYIYSNEITTTAHPTDQGYSGRCWIFASLNIFRHILIDKYKLSSKFELSAGYISFFDKLEKANVSLERLIDMVDYKTTNIKYINLLNDLIFDGGHWSYFVNLVEKYGVVPLTAFHECYNSYITEELNTFIELKLLDFNAKIRKDKSQIKELKEQYLQDIYNLLRQFMGEPPSKFDWKFIKDEDIILKNKCKNVKVIRDISPLEFYHESIANTYNIRNKVLLFHNPNEEVELYKKYARPTDTNMINGLPFILFTVELPDMKRALMKSIDNDEPCYIACDVRINFSHHYTVLSDKLFDYESLLKLNLSMKKADLFNMRKSYASHAMLVVGYDKNPEDEFPNKWKIQNSWGKTKSVHGQSESGYIHMMDDWFNNHVYQIAVDKKYIDDLEKLYEDCNDIIKLEEYESMWQ